MADIQPSVHMHRSYEVTIYCMVLLCAHSCLHQICSSNTAGVRSMAGPFSDYLIGVRVPKTHMFDASAEQCIGGVLRINGWMGVDRWMEGRTDDGSY